jgi:hypothetical protein
VCVVGVAMREEKAVLLLPGCREGKIKSYESVCVLVGMVGETKKCTKCTYTFVGAFFLGVQNLHVLLYGKGVGFFGACCLLLGESE